MDGKQLKEIKLVLIKTINGSQNRHNRNTT